MSEAKDEAKSDDKNDAKDNTKQTIMSCDFKIMGKIPKEAFEMFALAQAKILGLRGYIIQVSEDCFQGQLQGKGPVIEAFKQLILTAAEYVAAVQEFIINKLKAIDDYTYNAFEVKVKQAN